MSVFFVLLVLLFRLLVRLLPGLICVAAGRRLKKKGVGRGEAWETIGWTYIVLMLAWSTVEWVGALSRFFGGPG